MADYVSTVSSDKQRVTSPAVTRTELAQLAAGNSAFAFDLYQVLREKGGNLFYSPYSISLALAMTYAGARGETEQQMASTLHFTLSQSRLHPTFNALDLELAQRGKRPWSRDGDAFRLNIANALWGQVGYQFLPQFLDTLAENYGAGLNLLDFMGAPEASRVTINEWVSEQTEEKIVDLIPPGVIDMMTRLVLTNAIYFYATWASPFDERMTSDGPFYLPDGNQAAVPMMRQTESFAYAEGAGLQAVELPYDGYGLAMLILLPETRSPAAFEQTLDAARLEAILRDLSPQRVALTMPRFRFEADFMLKPALAALGMPDAFSTNADFSGMDGGLLLQIDDVIHKAFVAVDEAGTEAAAATAVVMAIKGIPIFEEPVEMVIDHPFIFLIRDRASGSVLFIGRVVDPSG